MNACCLLLFHIRILEHEIDVILYTVPTHVKYLVLLFISVINAFKNENGDVGI